MRAVAGVSPRHGRIWNVDGSGIASMSDSCTRAKPSIAEPSKPMPSAKAPSSSAGAMATDFRDPRTSVNHRRTKRTSRSSSARRTKSSCFPMAAVSHADCYVGVTRPSPLSVTFGSRPPRDAFGNRHTQRGGEAAIVSGRAPAASRPRPGQRHRRRPRRQRRSRGRALQGRGGAASAPRGVPGDGADGLPDRGPGDAGLAHPGVPGGDRDARGAPAGRGVRRPGRGRRLPRPGGPPPRGRRHPQERPDQLRRGDPRRPDRGPPGQAPPVELRRRRRDPQLRGGRTPSTSSRSAASTSRSRSARTCGATARPPPPRPPRPALLVVPNGSPYEADKDDVRLELCSRRAREGECALAYVNLVGGQDELVFDGDSIVVDQSGTVLGRSGQFAPELLVVDLDLPAATPTMPGAEERFGGLAIKRTIISSAARSRPTTRSRRVHHERMPRLEEIWTALVDGAARLRAQERVLVGAVRDVRRHRLDPRRRDRRRRAGRPTRSSASPTPAPGRPSTPRPMPPSRPGAPA